jgi:hypothetical protein
LGAFLLPQLSARLLAAASTSVAWKCQNFPFLGIPVASGAFGFVERSDRLPDGLGTCAMGLSEKASMIEPLISLSLRHAVRKPRRMCDRRV